MADFKTSSDKNTVDMNKVTEGFRSSLNAEKQDFSNLYAYNKLDIIELNLLVSEKLTKLQNDLATKNKIMDALPEQTQKTKVLTKKLKNDSSNIVKLEKERSLVKGWTSEINQLFFCKLLKLVILWLLSLLDIISLNSFNLYSQCWINCKVFQEARLLWNKGWWGRKFKEWDWSEG